MIISHKHRFIFFAVPKTATHAVRAALREHLEEGDWEQQMLFGEQTIPIGPIAALKHGHISFQQVSAHLPERIWKTYYKFGFVRNPFERFVSSCIFLNRRNPDFKGHETDFMKRVIADDVFMRRVLVIPQYRLLADEDNRIMMDYVGRYETLQTSYGHICKEIGIPESRLPKENESLHAHYASYYDDDLKRSVASFYHLDFKFFGYNPELLHTTTA